MSYRLVLAAMLGLATAGASAAPLHLVLDRVVLVMRHGIRPPTKAPAMPAEVTPERWPDWTVPPGWLTAHGAHAVEALGRADKVMFMRASIVPSKGCPPVGAVVIFADSDQRTLATADAWSKGFAPDCAIAALHRPQGEDDPMFSPLGKGAPLDAVAANTAVKEAIGIGGLAALDREYAPTLHRLDAILCGDRASACGVARTPTQLVEATAVDRPKLRGALDRASTAAQILLLEYVEGKPMAEVGWGRATAGDVMALSAFHALEFRLLARPLPVARANLAPIVDRIESALTSANAPAITLFSGHDTQIANLGGLLGVHWHIAGFAADDPVPGGAIVIERLYDRAGRQYIRLLYRAQSLEQLRAGRGDAPIEERLTAEGCAALCPIDQFRRLLRR